MSFCNRAQQAGPTSPAPGHRAHPLKGECESCKRTRLQRRAHDDGHDDHALGAEASPDLPPLLVGPAHDALELQAHRIADDMSGSAQAMTSAGVVRPIAAGKVQRAAANAGAAAQAAPESVHAVLRGAGEALGASERRPFERRLGAGFADVRLHRDADAARSAAAIGARAYTVGNHIAFGAGQYAPGTSQGRRLLAHELVHTLQQRGARPLVQRDLIYAGGYPNPFAGNVAAETAAAAKSSEWFPSSVDFAQTASLSGGGTGLASLGALLTAIEAKGAGELTAVDLVGHANGDLFGLGGKITRSGVTGSKGGTIGPNQLAAVQPRIDKLRDRFAAGANITVYGCNSGISKVLLAAISKAFKVCARGFKDEINWCLDWQTKPLKITSRGRTLVKAPPGLKCDDYHGSIYNHTPDQTDCSGTQPPAPDIDLPKREPRVPEVPR